MRFAARPLAQGLILPPGEPFSEQDQPASGHPSPETLQRFAAGVASRAECREVVAHLMKGCATCAASCRRSVYPPVQPSACEAAIDRFVARLGKTS